MSCPKKPSLRDFMTEDDKVHDKYCNSKGGDAGIFCNPAEGCLYEHDRDPKEGPDCRYNTDVTIGNVYINGGIAFGKLCLDNEFTRMVLMIVYPPLYVFIMEKKSGFKNIKAIIMCFIYTCMFYFPGLIFALHYKVTGSNCLM